MKKDKCPVCGEETGPNSGSRYLHMQIWTGEDYINQFKIHEPCTSTLLRLEAKMLGREDVRMDAFLREIIWY
jgi:hypothetical protein